MRRPCRLTSPEVPEAAILDAVLRYLSVDKRVAWAHRFNTGAQVIEEVDARGRKSRRFVRYAFPGCSDVLGQLRTGHFLAVETKTRVGRATAEQAAFLETVECAGGLAILARSVDDVRDGVERFVAAIGGNDEAGAGSSPTRTRCARPCGRSNGRPPRRSRSSAPGATPRTPTPTPTPSRMLSPTAPHRWNRKRKRGRGSSSRATRTGCIAGRSRRRNERERSPEWLRPAPAR